MRFRLVNDHSQADGKNGEGNRGNSEHGVCQETDQEEAPVRFLLQHDLQQQCHTYGRKHTSFAAG